MWRGAARVMPRMPRIGLVAAADEGRCRAMSRVMLLMMPRVACVAAMERCVRFAALVARLADLPRSVGGHELCALGGGPQPTSGSGSLGRCVAALRWCARWLRVC